ncbi:MAG: hypothetical protein PHP50_01345 [Lachnospiraceae bacterium]|nr:hypothetical protein [Lachnospiraceae bacterium]
MMKFRKELYCSETIKNPKLIKWRLQHHVGQPSVYVLVISDGPDQLDIYHSNVLLQPVFRNIPLLVVGIADGYQAALELVQQMTCDAMKETGTCDIKNFLISKKP